MPELSGCNQCNLKGCFHRTEDYYQWNQSDKDFDAIHRYMSKKNCMCATCKIRRERIASCPLVQTPTKPVETSREKIEYLVEVEWYYDVMPSNKHRKKVSVMATSAKEATALARDKYPNSTVHKVWEK